MSAAPCKRCGQRPKKLPQHFCDVCLEVRLPPSEQAAKALGRMAAWAERQAGGELPPVSWVRKSVREQLGKQWCASCGEFRYIDIELPNKVKLHVAPGASRCRACIAVQRREAIYGLTPQQQADLLAVQGGKCAICRRDQKMRALAVEHNHETKLVRGFGCKHCNHDVLGNLYDSPEMALRALVYLINPPARKIGIGEPALNHAEVLDKILAMYAEVFGE
jgi:hypothetical protein